MEIIKYENDNDKYFFQFETWNYYFYSKNKQNY